MFKLSGDCKNILRKKYVGNSRFFLNENFTRKIHSKSFIFPYRERTPWKKFSDRVYFLHEKNSSFSKSCRKMLISLVNLDFVDMSKIDYGADYKRIIMRLKSNMDYFCRSPGILYFNIINYLFYPQIKIDLHDINYHLVLA